MSLTLTVSQNRSVLHRSSAKSAAKQSTPSRAKASSQHSHRGCRLQNATHRVGASSRGPGSTWQHRLIYRTWPKAYHQSGICHHLPSSPPSSLYTGSLPRTSTRPQYYDTLELDQCRQLTYKSPTSLVCSTPTTVQPTTQVTPPTPNPPALKPVHSSSPFTRPPTPIQPRPVGNAIEHCNKNATYRTNTPESSIAVLLW